MIVRAYLGLVVRSLLSVLGSSVNRPTKHGASAARGQFWIGRGEHESHHEALNPASANPSLH
jgi:hypothetical protein